MQTGHIGPTVMIRVVQRQHGGSFLGLVWDPGITLFDSSTTIREESTNFDFPEFTFGRLRSGCLEEWSSEELTEFMQLMIAWLIRSSQVDSCISTLQTSAMSRGCFTSYRLVWDPGDFTTYGILVFAWRDFADDVLGYCLDDAWMIAVGWGCWSIRDFPFDTWRLGVMDALSVCGHIDFSWMSDFRVGLYVMVTPLRLSHWQDIILDSGDDSLRHYNLGLQEWRMQSRQEGQISMIRVAQRQHDESFLVIAWDPGILWVDSLAASTDGRESCYFQEPIHMAKWISFLGGTFYEEYTESSQYLVSLLIGGLQGAPGVSTLQDNIVGGRCSTSFRMVWDPGIIISFSWVQLVVPMGVMALLEDKQSLGREDLSCPHFWIPLFDSGNDFVARW
jgi:hypothetical protein